MQSSGIDTVGNNMIKYKFFELHIKPFSLCRTYCYRDFICQNKHHENYVADVIRRSIRVNKEDLILWMVVKVEFPDLHDFNNINWESVLLR